MSFYNPFSPKPDWGQGLNDAIQQFLQLYMMKKMMGGQQQQQIPPNQATAMPGVGMGAGSRAGMEQGLPMQPPQMGSAANMGQQIDPQMLMQLLSMLSGRRI